MRLGKHISELLYKRESVDVPGLGTFTKKYIPARFIPEKKIVEAPRKIADFITTAGDTKTPLVEFMAEREGATHEEVLRFLENVVGEIHRTLDAGKTVELENLGRFFKKADGGLQFEANTDINYLEDTTDTDAVKAPEQQDSGTQPGVWPTHQGSQKSEPDEFQEKDADKHAGEMQHSAYGGGPAPVSHPENHNNQNQTTMTEPEERKKMPAALRWLLIIGIPLLVIAIILLLNFNYFFGKEGLISNWRLFSTEKEVVTEVPEEDPDQVIAEVYEVAAEPEPPAPVKEDTTDRLLTPEPGRPVYYLVVGSFRNEDKAGKLALELEAMGADRANVLEKTPSHYYRVSYGFYHDLNEARRRKQDLPQELRNLAWILHR